MDLGRVGVWWSGAWRVAEDASIDVAAELEEAANTALWPRAGSSQASRRISNAC